MAPPPLFLCDATTGKVEVAFKVNGFGGGLFLSADGKYVVVNAVLEIEIWELPTTYRDES